MNITANDVKTLRDRSGAGMMDCKRALVEAGGDIERAEKILKELGFADVAKLSGRATGEGRIFTTVGDRRAGIVELNCETDFVARTKEFVAVGAKIVSLLTEQGLNAGNPQIDRSIGETVAALKENIALRRELVIDLRHDEIAAQYVHGDAGTIGVIVTVRADNSKSDERLATFAFDVALHVAAFRPTWLSQDDVDERYRLEQTAIFRKQADRLDKPDRVIDAIVKGKLKKHLASICLLDQPFVKDEKRSVAKVAHDVGVQIGATVEVGRFVWYRVGEASE